jgi:hypothetical protein
MSAETDQLLARELRALRVDAADDGFRANLLARLESANVYPLFGTEGRSSGGFEGLSESNAKALSTRRFWPRLPSVSRGRRIALLVLAALFISGGAAALIGGNPLQFLLSGTEEPARSVKPAAASAAPKSAAQSRPRQPPTPKAVIRPPSPEAPEVERIEPALGPMEIPKLQPEVHAPRAAARLRDGAAVGPLQVSRPQGVARPMEIPRVDALALERQEQNARPVPPFETPLAIPKLRPRLDADGASEHEAKRRARAAEEGPPRARGPHANETPRARAAEKERPARRPRSELPNPDRETPPRVERIPERLRRR